MSKKSSNIPPQNHKSAEELKKEAELKHEVNRQRDLVANKAYPFLIKHAKNISDANNFLMTCKMAIGQAFSNQKRIQTLDELKVIENTDPKADRVEEFREFLEIFRNEKILTAEQLIEGLGTAFDSFIRKEMMDRQLSTLKTDFLPVEEVKPENNGTVQK